MNQNGHLNRTFVEKVSRFTHRPVLRTLLYCRNNGLTMGYGISGNSMSQYGLKLRKLGSQHPRVSAKYKHLFEEDCSRSNKLDRPQAVESNGLGLVENGDKCRRETKEFNSAEEKIKMKLKKLRDGNCANSKYEKVVREGAENEPLDKVVDAINNLVVPENVECKLEE